MISAAGLSDSGDLAGDRDGRDYILRCLADAATADALVTALGGKLINSPMPEDDPDVSACLSAALRAAAAMSAST